MKHRVVHCALILIAIMLLPCNAQAQSNVDSSRRSALVRAIENVAPAVVSINVVEIQRERAVDPIFQDFFDVFRVPGGRIREKRVESIGSGFIYDKSGHIVTNFHVLDGADMIESVTLPGGRRLEVEFVGADVRNDLAVLKAKEGDLPVAFIGSSTDLMIGEWAIAIGNPFGTLMVDPQPTVSVGVISAKARRVVRSIGDGERLYQGLIQTDAAINPGNSGGPLVNALGEVIGINTLIFSQSGGNVGLGFALPIDRAKLVVDEIIRYGRRRDPWPGFKVDDVRSVPPTLKREYAITSTHGSVVVEIQKDSPAYNAGLRAGDVIVRMNRIVVMDPSDIDFEVWSAFVGDTMEVEVERAGQRQTVKFEVKELRR